MDIEPTIWSKMHGAATHFPIALMFVSTLCDTAALAIRDEERRRGLQFTAGVTILLGALTIGGNLVVDVLYAWIDPKIRY